MAEDPAALARVLRTRAKDGVLRLPSSGLSMGPRFAEGSILQVTDTPRAPRVGEIWAFIDRSGAVIAHRHLRSIRDDRHIFFGDVAPSADLPVPRQWLVGRVTGVVSGNDDTWTPRRVDGVLPVIRALGRGARRRLRRRH